MARKDERFVAAYRQGAMTAGTRILVDQAGKPVITAVHDLEN